MWCEPVACHIDSTGSTHRGPRTEITVADIRYGFRQVSHEDRDRIADSDTKFYCEIDVEDIGCVGVRGDILHVSGVLSVRDIEHILTLLRGQQERAAAAEDYWAKSSRNAGAERLVDIVRRVGHLSIREADLAGGYHGAVEFDPEHTTIYLDRSHSDSELVAELTRAVPDVLVADQEHRRLMQFSADELEDGDPPAEAIPAAFEHPGWCVRDLCTWTPSTEELDHESAPVATIPVRPLRAGIDRHRRWQLNLVRADIVRGGQPPEIGETHVEARAEELVDGAWVATNDEDGLQQNTIMTLAEAKAWADGTQRLNALVEQG